MCFVQGAFEEAPVARFRPLSMRMGVVMIGFPWPRLVRKSVNARFANDQRPTTND
jgi:hypothetical protein